MKAILCKEYGSIENLSLEEIPSPKIGKKQVLIEVKACGVNFPDILVVEGKYQAKPPLPFAPGAEVAGIIKAIGENVSHLKIGDKVFASLLFGGFATEAVAEASAIFPIPEGMDFITASAIMLTYGTSYHALADRAKLQKGETLLVLGAAGGVGLAAVDLGKVMGAKVIACASSDDKLALCKAYSADELINYSTQDLKESIKKMTNGKGVDVVYDPVGGPYSEQAFRAIAWEGRHLVVGFAAGDIPTLPLNLSLLKGASIVGVFWGAFTQRNPEKNLQNIQQLLTWFQAGMLKAHIHATFPLQDAKNALYALANREVKGKVVITM